MPPRPLLLGLALAFCSSAHAATLKQAYDLAPPAGGYDKYLILETGVTYTGGLWIGATFNPVTAAFEGDGLDVRIVGHGAILDLQGGEICIAYCTNRLDIDDCIVINGDIRFRGYQSDPTYLLPTGSVIHVTFYGPHDYGVRLHGCGPGIVIHRNLAVAAVDTGSDFMYLTGYASDWLPTGANFSVSMQNAFTLTENWSFHADPTANGDLLRHFSVLCDYG